MSQPLSHPTYKPDTGNAPLLGQGVTGAAVTAERPDAMVKRITQDLLDAIKADRDMQTAKPETVVELAEAKILPYIDVQYIAKMVVGRFWRDATPEQQRSLVNQFRTIVVYTYAGAISQIKDQKLVYSPMIDDGSDYVLVRSHVTWAHSDPMQLNYRLEKSPGGWKIRDIEMLGAWIVETYKGTCLIEIERGGVDGLIKALADRNKAAGR
jgi:phospholipid transport system substrate-binding protein